MKKFIFISSAIINLLFTISLILCCIFGFSGAYIAIFITLLMFAYHIDVRLIIGLLGLTIFRKRVNVESKIFHVSDSDCKFLNVMKVKDWKDRYFAMERSQFVITNFRDKDVLKRVLSYNITAEVTHWLCLFFGAFAILIGCFISIDEWWIYLITTILAGLFCDVLPIMIQRFNRYRLQKVYAKLK